MFAKSFNMVMKDQCTSIPWPSIDLFLQWLVSLGNKLALKWVLVVTTQTCVFILLSAFPHCIIWDMLRLLSVMLFTESNFQPPLLMCSRVRDLRLRCHSWVWRDWLKSTLVFGCSSALTIVTKGPRSKKKTRNSCKIRDATGKFSRSV